jgi:hypothetical protein
MAPALAPLTASKETLSSSSSRSSTPHVKAPNAPPPCSARETRGPARPRAVDGRRVGPRDAAVGLGVLVPAPG